jgi:hypothetical protein
MDSEDRTESGIGPPILLPLRWKPIWQPTEEEFCKASRNT